MPISVRHAKPLDTTPANARGARRTAYAVVLLLGFASSATLGGTGTQPAARPTDASAEETLWQRIATLHATPPTSQPFEQWFVTAQRRDALLRDQLRLYLTLYPGGQHRDEAIRIELANLFELGTLRGGDLAPLRARIAEILRAPPSPAAEEEAAYAELLCQPGEPGPPPPPTRQATTAPIRPLDIDLPAAYRRYIARYPRGRHVPRLATRLFEEAARHADREGMRAIAEHLGTHFPNHEETEMVLGTWNRLESVGRPFWAALRTIDERTLDTREYVGHSVLIVVWAGFDDAARQCVQRVEQFRCTYPDVRVIGVALDETADATRVAARALGIEWPQCNDGRGWGDEFTRNWGVRQVPFVFVIDRAGMLAGATGGDNWERLAAQALVQRAPPPDSGSASDGNP